MKKALASQLSALHGKPVVILSEDASKHARGTLVVETDPEVEGIRRVDIIIESDQVNARIGVPAARWPKLLESWDGARVTLTMTLDEHFWSPKER